MEECLTSDQKVGGSSPFRRKLRYLRKNKLNRIRKIFYELSIECIYRKKSTSLAMSL